MRRESFSREQKDTMQKNPFTAKDSLTSAMGNQAMLSIMSPIMKKENHHKSGFSVG